LSRAEPRGKAPGNRGFSFSRKARETEGGWLLLVGNPRSRRGRAGFEAARRALESAGGRPRRVLLARSPADVRRGIEDALDAGCGAVAVAGGDGTVGLAAGVLAGTNAVLGVLPAGTGNDFARTLDLPLDLEGAARAISGGTVRAVDVGAVNGRLFVNAASLGLSAEVARRVGAAQKRHLGRLAYPLAALRLLFSHRPFRVRFAGDVEFAGWTHQVVVANGRYQGGGTPTLEEADPSSGRLAVYVVEGRSRWIVFLVGLLVRFGRHTDLPPTQTFEARRFSIQTDGPQRIDADGEEIATTPAEFSILPGALRVFVPEEVTVSRKS
jgi:YegS/Rv2252/BmrU family lipid kinase